MEFNDVRLSYGALQDEIDGAIRQILAGGRYILGPSVQTFEDEFASYCRAADGIAVGSGTDAISIALRAIDVMPQDEVLVPAVSAAATAMAVALWGRSRSSWMCLRMTSTWIPRWLSAEGHHARRLSCRFISTECRHV